MRSAGFQKILHDSEINSVRIKNGYKSIRKQNLDIFSDTKKIIVIAGGTGTGNPGKISPITSDEVRQSASLSSQSSSVIEPSQSWSLAMDSKTPSKSSQSSSVITPSQSPSSEVVVELLSLSLQSLMATISHGFSTNSKLGENTTREMQ